MLRAALVLILMIVIARAFWRMVDGLIAGLAGKPLGTTTPQASVKMERDPVCGTYVVADRAVAISEGSRRVYFCSTACRDKYKAA
jgi:YHS domain-containing protein